MGQGRRNYPSAAVACVRLHHRCAALLAELEGAREEEA